MNPLHSFAIGVIAGITLQAAAVRFVKRRPLVKPEKPLPEPLPSAHPPQSPPPTPKPEKDPIRFPTIDGIGQIDMEEVDDLINPPGMPVLVMYLKDGRKTLVEVSGLNPEIRASMAASAFKNWAFTYAQLKCTGRIK